MVGLRLPWRVCQPAQYRRLGRASGLGFVNACSIHTPSTHANPSGHDHYVRTSPNSALYLSTPEPKS